MLPTILYFVGQAAAASVAGVHGRAAIKVPPTVVGNPQVIDGSFQSFSIEYNYMADYAGNKTWGKTTHLSEE